ncbi:MAG TPA: alpha/beta fold hydrolase [Patescibacteria group bacterium]|nr:alpha/beta fold hydrolase [Patescibacteria group bacterium]
MIFWKKSVIFSVISVALGSAIGYALWMQQRPFRMPVSSLVVEEYHRTLDQYAFLALRARTPQKSEITLQRVLERKPMYTSYLFTYRSNGKQVSGQANIPVKQGLLPAIVLIRGFVDKEIYRTGLGTYRAADAFAEHGYITFAPDFLGYGESASESANIFESRFEKAVSVLDLLESVSTIRQVDGKRIGIWGHSNGGQIALSVLEITKYSYPTTLWAPVTLKFPDSILQYIDELPDKGAYLTSQLARLQDRYDAAWYSVDTYLSDITAPLLLHQGTSDEEVPESWSTAFYERMRGMNKPITYYTYDKENHNFNNGSAPMALKRDLVFFARYL